MVGGFLQGLRGFAIPPGSGMLFPGLSLFYAFGLSLFGSLPSFLTCSSGVFAAWWLFFPLGKLLHYVRLGLLIQRWFPWGCVLCCLSRVSLTLPGRGSVFFLRLRLVRRLSPSVVFLSCLRNEVTLVFVECRLWFLPLDQNEGLIYWSRLYSFGMGSPFGSSVLSYTLDHDRRFTFSYWFLFLHVGVTCQVR